jgi:UDP-N-acetylglucosamine 3-dehydrogenase
VITFGLISFAHMHADSYAWVLRQIEESTGEACLVAASDDSRERLKSKCAQFKIENVFEDYRDLLSSDVDAVIISSENARHVDHIIAAIDAGKHIICEKPICTSSQSIAQIEDALKRSKSPVFFQTAFPMRYDATVAEAKRTLDAGTLGAIKAISSTNHGTFPGGWFADVSQSGGGAIMDHTVHVADLVRYLTGDEFGSVRAFKGKNLHPNLSVEDNAMLYARLKRSQIPVSIDCSWSRMEGWPIWGDVKLELICEHGVLKIDCFNPHLDLVSEGRFSWHGMSEDLNQKMILGFCRAVVSRTEPVASFLDGAAAASVALAAYRSLGENDTVVV